MPSASPPAKRKERSRSSLVVSTPKVPMQRGLTGRRTKATARKRIADFRGCSFSVEGSPKKEDSAEDHPSGSTSPDSSNKISQRKRQDRTYFPSTAFCMLLEDKCPYDLTSSYGNRDGKMPVSFIQKYVVKKLDLTSEAEVEIMCQGQPVVPSLQLHSLVDYWFRTASTAKKIPATVGSSSKDFVMVLSYCRKVQAP
ncbi:putative prefoldin subunit 4-like [Hibiscus syriacus]|uniref:Prefoldin subunit 4-like n=1 Tax=Hibiscus syriacus TaxID=106335 RepID=A0A6A3BZ62_HIBSY|nr:putative prefoldin subunit 4-like [Hibiscus syriacus]